MNDRGWHGLAAAAVVPMALLAVAPSRTLALALAALAWVVLAVRGGLWRSMVAMSCAASLLRGQESLVGMLPLVGWQVAQFAPLVVAIIGLAIRRPARGQFAPTTLMGLFVAIAGLTVFASVNRSETAISLGLLVLVLVFGHLSVTVRWRDTDTIRGDLVFVFYLAAIAQAGGLAGRAAGAEWAVGEYDRFIGLTSNANFAGALSATTLPLVFLAARDRGLRGRLLVAAGAGSLGYALFLSGSRGALLAAAVGLVVAGAVRTEQARLLRVALFVAFTSGAAIAYNPAILQSASGTFLRSGTADYGSGRLGIYQQVIDRWQEVPAFGTGFGTSETVLGLAAHNIFLTALLETGVVGGLLFLLAVISMWRSRAKVGAIATLSGAFVAVVLVDLTESTLFGLGGPTALIAWLVLLATAASGATAQAEVLDGPPPQAADPSRPQPPPYVHPSRRGAAG